MQKYLYPLAQEICIGDLVINNTTLNFLDKILVGKLNIVDSITISPPCVFFKIILSLILNQLKTFQLSEIVQELTVFYLLCLI